MIAVTRALSAELTSGRARAAAGCLLRRGRRTTSRCVGRHACRAFMEAEHPRRPTGTTRLPGRACAKHDLCIADHDVICSYLFLLVSCSIIETCKRFTADQRSLSPSRVSFAPPAIISSCGFHARTPAREERARVARAATSQRCGSEVLFYGHLGSSGWLYFC